jgi:hypothetical protein
MTRWGKDFWGWLILIVMGALLGVFGHYSLSIKDHNVFLTALSLLTLAVVVFFNLLYSKDLRRKKHIP